MGSKGSLWQSPFLRTMGAVASCSLMSGGEPSWPISSCNSVCPLFYSGGGCVPCDRIPCCRGFGGEGIVLLGSLWGSGSSLSLALLPLVSSVTVYNPGPPPIFKVTPPIAPPYLGALGEALTGGRVGSWVTDSVSQL